MVEFCGQLRECPVLDRVDFGTFLALPVHISQIHPSQLLELSGLGHAGVVSHESGGLSSLSV